MTLAVKIVERHKPRHSDAITSFTFSSVGLHQRYEYPRPPYYSEFRHSHRQYSLTELQEKARQYKDHRDWKLT